MGQVPITPRPGDRGTGQTFPSKRELGSDKVIDRFKATVTKWGFPEKIVSELIKGRPTAGYKKGSLIFSQNSPGDILFWVSSGLVKVSCPVKGRERITVALAGPGELIGFAYLLDDVNRATQAFQARAVTDCKLTLLTHQRVMKTLETLDPATLVRLIVRLNTEWSKAMQTRVRFLGLDLRTRLSEVFAQLSERFGVKDVRGVMLVPELSHGDLAEMIGCSRPAVSKLVEEMITGGILARRGKHYIMLNQAKPSAQLLRAGESNFL